jgi:hypothetical protein
MNHVLLNSLVVICMDSYWIIHLPFLSGHFLHGFFFCAWMLMTQTQPYTIYNECIKIIQYITQYYFSTDIQVTFIKLCPILAMLDIQVTFITLCPILTMLDIQVTFITLCSILTMLDIQVTFITICPILTMLLKPINQ